MQLKFKDILPNPYRDLKGNPLLKEKVAELVSSINTTGFWDNIVVRKNKAGKYELAYGHHRIAAAIEAGLESAEFIVKDLSDALMIQIMDNENREVYASSPASLIESVKAVVQALAESAIPAFKIDPKTNKEILRYAPSYVPGYPSRSSGRITYFQNCLRPLYLRALIFLIQRFRWACTKANLIGLPRAASIAARQFLISRASSWRDRLISSGVRFMPPACP